MVGRSLWLIGESGLVRHRFAETQSAGVSLEGAAPLTHEQHLNLAEPPRRVGCVQLNFDFVHDGGCDHTCTQQVS
jgi:hypothetical protein